MIEESYVQAAIRIRRHYLKISNDMSLYEKKAKNTLKKLEDLSNFVKKTQEELNNTKVDKEESVKKINEAVLEINKQTSSLNDDVDPMNKEVEKLLIEEQELWKKIKEKYNNLNEDDIINYIKDRLIKENLS